MHITNYKKEKLLNPTYIISSKAIKYLEINVNKAREDIY